MGISCLKAGEEVNSVFTTSGFAAKVPVSVRTVIVLSDAIGAEYTGARPTKEVVSSAPPAVIAAREPLRLFLCGHRVFS